MHFSRQSKDKLILPILLGLLSDENGDALPGVNVSIKGTSRGVATNSAGVYSISVADSKAILVFSFVSYQSQEVPVGNRTTINVSLGAEIKSLRKMTTAMRFLAARGRHGVQMRHRIVDKTALQRRSDDTNFIHRQVVIGKSSKQNIVLVYQCKST